MAVEDDLLNDMITRLQQRKRWPSYKQKWETEGSHSPIYALYQLAWFIFEHASTLSVGRHYAGQRVTRLQCEELRNKSHQEQRDVAAQWNHQLEQIIPLKEKIENSLNQEPSRENDGSTADSPSPTEAFQPLLDQAPVSTIFDTSANNQILVRAPLLLARELLPPDLYDAVHREPYPTMPTTRFAAIAMQFSSAFNNNECIMTILIRANTVAHFASKWFDVRIESNQGLRYIRFPNSPTTVKGANHLVLSGFRRNILASEFGLTLSEAIMQGPRYLTDGCEENLGTSAVWMKMSNNANEEAEVALSLSLLRGTDIRMVLYPS